MKKDIVKKQSDFYRKNWSDSEKEQRRSIASLKQIALLKLIFLNEMPENNFETKEALA